MFEHGLSGRLWPIHGTPYADETLSSWLARLSRAHGANPIRFCTQALPHRKVWQRDVDKGTDDALLLELADKTSTPRKRVLGTTIRGYPGYLTEDLMVTSDPLGYFRWDYIPLPVAGPGCNIVPSVCKRMLTRIFGGAGG